MSDGLWLRNFPFQDLPRYGQPVEPSWAADETSGRSPGLVDESN